MRIRQITELRNTQKISKLVHESDDPIYITKNGYGDMVLMSLNAYESLTKKNEEEIKKERKIIPNEDVQDNFGLIKCLCAPISIKVANPSFNKEQIINTLKDADKRNVKIVVFPELSISSYTAGDLFLNSSFLNRCLKSALSVVNESKELDIFFTFGVPFSYKQRLYNVAFCCYKGEILGIVPKSYIPNQNEYYESRYFASGLNINTKVEIDNKIIPFSSSILFQNKEYKNMTIGVEICEDLWIPSSPSTRHALNGATIILNLSASNETFLKDEYRRNLILTTSKKLEVAYLYCSSSQDESTQDLIFSGSSIIAQDGDILKESSFTYSGAEAIIDINLLCNRRRQMMSYPKLDDMEDKILFSMPIENIEFPILDKTPFLPKDNKLEAYQKILYLQASGLVKRLKHTNIKKVVLGLSGGLDSTLAYLASIKALDILNLSRENVIAISMPCFGTSNRTRNNAISLAKYYKTTFLEIPLDESVKLHMKDLNLDEKDHNVAYENAQARERTQVLMDYANKENALVIGTGDLSEIALGWSTYNGDHMSMYALNCSLPKTLIKEMLTYLKDEGNKEVIEDIISTPISPELLPTDEKGNIKQQTEDIIGPYILNDFFLYHFIYNQFSLTKIYYLAINTFKNEYDNKTIMHWLKSFIKRFFSQQFKRSCMPDGVKVSLFSLSPRGDLRMPSDASYEDFIKELEAIENN